MKLTKLVLTLLVAVITTAVSGQENESIVRKGWEDRADSVKSVREIVDLHRKTKKILTSNNDLLANDIFAVVTAGNYIYENLDKKVESAEKQLYAIAKSVDVTTKEFASFFIDNTYPLKSFFYVKYLSEGEPRQLAMGSNYSLNPDWSYESIDYDYKRLIEVLEKCDVSIRENHCSTVLSDRMDANENLRNLEPILEKQLPDSEFKRKILDRINTVKPLMRGEPAPEWSYPDRHGNYYSLSDFRGKFLVIDMWATW